MVGMQGHSVDLGWLYNNFSYAFMRFESAVAVDVLALVITIFCFTRNIAAA